MHDNPQPEEFEARIATDLDAWMTARMAGREQLASLSNLDLQTVELSALAQDLLSLAEDIQPDPNFVLDLEARLRYQAISSRSIVRRSPTGSRIPTD